MKAIEDRELIKRVFTTTPLKVKSFYKSAREAARNNKKCHKESEEQKLSQAD